MFFHEKSDPYIGALLVCVNNNFSYNNRGVSLSISINVAHYFSEAAKQGKLRYVLRHYIPIEEQIRPMNLQGLFYLDFVKSASSSPFHHCF